MSLGLICQICLSLVICVCLLGQGANAALSTIPFVEKFGDVAQVDFSLVSAPTFGGNYLTLNSKGEFTSQAHPVVRCSPLSNSGL